VEKYGLYQAYLKASLCEGQREGQAVFNAVLYTDKEIANHYRGSEFDCFYDDSKILIFLSLVFLKWSQE